MKILDSQSGSNRISIESCSVDAEAVVVVVEVVVVDVVEVDVIVVVGVVWSFSLTISPILEANSTI